MYINLSIFVFIIIIYTSGTNTSATIHFRDFIFYFLFI